MIAEYIAGVDIGGTKIIATIADATGIKARVYQHTQLQGDILTIPKQVYYLIQKTAEYAGIHYEEVKAVGISTCSPFEKKGNYKEIVAPNLCGGLTGNDRLPNSWHSIPLEEFFNGLYSHIVVENDCVAAVVAEKLFGAGKLYDNLVYVTWSTGIGAGAYVDGKLIRGKNGNAPHFGHIYMLEDGPQCGCGNYGDLEAIASGTAIARDYGVHSAKEVFDNYRKGDTKAIHIVHRAARNFARGLASLNALFDTEYIVLGGSVMNDSDILLPLIRKEFYSSFPVLSKSVIIEKSVLFEYIADISALSLVMPASWIESWRTYTPWMNAPELIKL
ncbi:MAG: ROK family protein [Spirochaetes bacterium]|nr:ROK family protein [Spirochaetota bacterium]